MTFIIFKLHIHKANLKKILHQQQKNESSFFMYVIEEIQAQGRILD